MSFGPVTFMILTLCFGLVLKNTDTWHRESKSHQWTWEMKDPSIPALSAPRGTHLPHSGCQCALLRALHLLPGHSFQLLVAQANGSSFERVEAEEWLPGLNGGPDPPGI